MGGGGGGGEVGGGGGGERALLGFTDIGVALSVVLRLGDGADDGKGGGVRGGGG